MQGLVGKRVLVTGASSGIGRAIAIRFAQEGAHVALNYHEQRDGAEETLHRTRTAPRCADARDVAPSYVTMIEADVASEAAVAHMVEQTIAELGGLDILINNAGVHLSRPSHELDLPSFEWVLQVNLRGAFLCARAVIAHLVGTQRPGVIINISSVHEIIPKPQYLGYAASRGAMGSLTRTLALEYAGHAIRVNAVAPGATATPINRAWVDDPAKYADVVSHVPLGRAGRAEEMAAATAFLCSDDAAYITGQTLYVDGGLTLYADFRTAWSSE